MKELIKHFVDRAGWRLAEGVPEVIAYGEACGCFIDSFKENSDGLFFSKFLQDSIQGVNKEGEYRVSQDESCITVKYGNHYRWLHVELFENYTSPDQAKIAALQWIMEQEK